MVHFHLARCVSEMKIPRRMALRASDARLMDARGFVAAASCELFSGASARKRSQSPKKRKPERETVSEVESTMKPSTKSNQKHSLGAEVEGMPSDAFSTKRARRNSSAYFSTSEDLS